MDPRNGRKPPVVVAPAPRQPGQQPGRGGRVMPVPPRNVDREGLLDPRRHGDHRTYTPPTRHEDGRPVTERPWTNARGRHIPPSHNHVTIINNTTIINNIDHVHRGWDRNNHGYSWHHWDGHHIRHHYDAYGYHWWDFYIGDRCFRTRYHSGRHWWYDPYWHRWVYLHDGRWWWQDPFAPAVVYVIINDSYYRYQDNGGTIVVKPDPTPPVDAPPAEPNQPTVPDDQETIYSADGTRSIQILGAAKEAFLYDLTAADPNSAAAAGQWLATGVKTAKFVYDDKHEADGTTTQVMRQIEIDFEDPKMAAVADPNGERKIVIFGDERSAYLYDLKNETAPSAFLAEGVSEIKMVNGETTDASGKVERALKLVIVTAKDGGEVDTLILFNRDGLPYESDSAPTPNPLSGSGGSTDAPAAQRVHGSAAFQTLRTGRIGW